MQKTKSHEDYGFTYQTFLGKKGKFKLNSDDIEKIKFVRHNKKIRNSHPTNLTNELSKFQYGEIGVKRLLQENPNLSPIVGSLPQKWGKLLAGKSGLEKIDDVFYSISKKYHSGHFTVKDLNNVQAELSKILNANVKIEILDAGMVGQTFKINVNGQNFVLKAFHSTPQNSGHGNYDELSSAVFAGKNDPKHYAKFYFGRFGENNDGYILTKFIDENTKGLNPNKFSFKEVTRVTDSYDKGHNVIGSKIIDYGQVHAESIIANFTYEERKILKALSSALDDNNKTQIENIITKYSAFEEFANPMKYIQGIVHSYCFRHSDGKLLIEYFKKREDCLNALGITILPKLNQISSVITNDSSFRIGIQTIAYSDEAGKYYGLTTKEWLKMFGNYGSDIKK